MIKQLKRRGIMFAASMLIFGLGSVVAIQRLPGHLVDRMLEGEVERQAVHWLNRAVSGLEGGTATFESRIVTSNDIGLLNEIVAASDLYRFKLIASDGEVFWSTRTSDIGSVTAGSYFADKVSVGEIVHQVAVKPAAEVDNFDLRESQMQHTFERTVAEVYTPVIGPDGFVGAIKFSLDLTESRTSYVSRIQSLLWLLFSATFLTVLGFAGATVRSIWQMKQRSQDERDVMEQQIQLTHEVKLLGELNEWLQSASSLDELFEMVSQFLSNMLPGCEGSIYVYSNSREVLDGLAAWNDAEAHDHIRPEECWGLRRGRAYSYVPGELGFACEHTGRTDRNYLCFPILAHGETIGLMHMRAAKDIGPEVFQGIQRLSQMAAEQISIAIANVRMRDQLHEQSIRDPLTGLFNRRHMNESLRKLVQKAQKGGTQMSVLMVDVDHFKKFNDNHGHDAGDIVLRSVGTMLDKFCDGDEVACRMGGEEFVVLIPEQDIETAMLRGETIRKSIEELRVRHAEKNLPRITASFGVAQYPIHGTTPKELLRASDDALYEAKSLGRNRVVVASVFLGVTGDNASDAPQDQETIEFFEQDQEEDTGHSSLDEPRAAG